MRDRFVFTGPVFDSEISAQLESLARGYSLEEAYTVRGSRELWWFVGLSGGHILETRSLVRFLEGLATSDVFWGLGSP